MPKHFLLMIVIRPFITFFCGLALALGTLSSSQAENWPHWRGPLFNGSSPESNLPEKFSRTENVLWSADLPGSGAATPIIWGGRVFISSVDAANQALVALCFDHGSGRLVWSNQVSSGAISKDDRSNFASASPVTDGKVVVFFYSSGDLAAYDFSGKKIWARNMQKDYGQFAFLWTFSSSPTLFDNKIFLQVLQRNVPVNGRGRQGGPNDSYLLALEPQTGKELWKVIRPSDARDESFEAYTTPIPFTDKGRTELLIAGGDCLTAHDPATGKEFWRWGTWNPQRRGDWRLVPSPVAGGGVVLACAPKRAPVYAVKTGGAGKQDDSALAWKSQERGVSSDVSTPLFYKGRFYVLNSDDRLLSSIEPATGKVFWTGDLKAEEKAEVAPAQAGRRGGRFSSQAKIEASPTGADDKIYAINFKGEVFVVGTGDTFQLLHRAAMGSDADKQIRSTIAVSQDHLFIRTDTKLYCIGKK